MVLGWWVRTFCGCKKVALLNEKKITYGEWGHMQKKPLNVDEKNSDTKMVSEDAIWEKDYFIKNEKKLLIDYIKLYNNGEWGHSLSEKIMYLNEKKWTRWEGMIKIKQKL